MTSGDCDFRAITQSKDVFFLCHLACRIGVFGLLWKVPALGVRWRIVIAIGCFFENLGKYDGCFSAEWQIGDLDFAADQMTANSN
jgi:hypothetical protein